MLLVMIILPLAFGLALLVPVPAFNKKRNVHLVALLGTLGALAVSLGVAWQFDWSQPAHMALSGSVRWIDGFGLSFSYGIDSISLWLVLLTTCLMPLVVIGSYNSLSEEVGPRRREFYFWMLLLETAMLGTFVATDIIFFYICFEFTLVPLYFLIGIFGSDDRLKAAQVFFFYTFTGSMLVFAGVLYVAWVAASADGIWTFQITELTRAAQGMSVTEQGWVLASLLAGFAVKVPLFPFHTWLPLAHTEAPTSGSVILAGVLLKLGTYGLLRLAIPMCPTAVVAFAPTIGVLAVVGILYTALICWVQTDIKRLIAYSSVSHLGFCVLGMFALTTEGMSGSVMYMINHGISTGALFLCVGMIYERFHTRRMNQLGGLAKVLPVWSFFMVFFCLASVGVPTLNGFVGEFLTLIGTFSSKIYGPSYAVAAGFGMIVAAIYILYMVGRTIFGPLKLPDSHGVEDGHEPADLNLREIVTLTPLAVACLVLGLWPTPMLRSIDPPVNMLKAPALGVLEHLTPDDRLVVDQRQVEGLRIEDRYGLQENEK